MRAVNITRPEILIVDDEPSVRSLLAELLDEHYTCLTAASGNEALSLLLTKMPAVVISDVNMPGMSGLGLIPKVFDISPDTVVMITSGNQTIDNAIGAIRAGAFDFIKKPFELDHVEIAVKRAVDHHVLLAQKRRHDHELEALVEERAKQLNYLKYYDTVTDLPNRTMFDDHLSRTIRAANDGGSFAIAMTSPRGIEDLVHTLGGASRDSVLQQFGERLASAAKGPFLARYGAEEFALLLSPVTNVSEATAIVDKIFDATALPLRVAGHEIFLPAAVGISFYPHDGTDTHVLTNNAITAHSEAKRTSGNSYQFYATDLHKAAMRRLMLKNDLRHALERDQIQVHYQPKIDTFSGRITGSEALMRWLHPDEGFVSPAEFIPLAEETGLIRELGKWILLEACKQTRAWNDADHQLHVAVNVSAAQFDKELAGNIQEIVAGSGLRPELLNLEVTESSIIINVEEVIAALNDLKSLGIRISIDDFGTGYSSLGHLKRLPIDVLKIDRSFIEDTTTDADDASLVSAIVGLAHNLGLTVVAEGVETDEQLQFLKLLSCNEWQGYLFSRPVPADEFAELLRHSGQPVLVA